MPTPKAASSSPRQPSSHIPITRVRKPATLTPLLFPILLWLIGSFFYFGDLGRFSDDYSLSLRTLEDSAYHFPANPWTRWPYFSRPLHLIFISTNATVFHDTVWPPHLTTSLCHALAAWMLYRFLRTLRLAAPSAAAGAVLFLTFPLSYEVPLWPATVSISPALAIVCVCFTLIARWADTPEPTTSSLTRRCVALFLLGFCVPCFHEQPAALFALTSLVFFLALPRSCRPLRHLLRAHWKQITAYTAALGLACVFYAALLITTAPDYARGSPSRMPTLAELPRRLADIAAAATDALIGTRARHNLLGSLTFAQDTILTPFGITLLALALLTAAFWCRWAVRTMSFRGTGVEGTPVLPLPHTQWLFFAFLWFILSFLPLATVASGAMESRLLYVPACGICIALAALIDTFWRRLSLLRRPILLRALTAALALVLLLGSVSLVGYQRLMRERSRQDARIIAQLRAAIPAPPQGTVFLPLRHAQPGADTGYRKFDWAVDAGLSQPWSAWAWLSRGYERSDLSATHLYRNNNPPFDPASATADGIVYRSSLPGDAFHHLDDGTTQLAWDHVVPFVVERSGSVRLYRHLTLRFPDDTTRGITCTLVPEETAHDDPFVLELR